MNQNRNDKVKEITDRLQKGIEELFQSDKYKEYLTVMSRFTNYSFGNCMLIALQRPFTQAVAGYRSWQTNFNRQVKAGAESIKILAPTPYKQKVEETVLDETGHPVLDKDGNELKRLVEIPKVGFRVEHIFAYEDTTGTPLPEICNILEGKVENYVVIIDILKTISPVPIIFEEINSQANGYFHLVDRSIHIDSRLPELQTIKTTIHEIAHAYLHDKITGTDVKANKNEREVCAESVAFTVCSYLGLPTDDYSFGYKISRL